MRVDVVTSLNYSLPPLKHPLMKRLPDWERRKMKLAEFRG